jgi:crotonobetaine/carnitine-CoA ligase
VLIWLPNGRMALKAWFGTNCLGAVSVAINTAYRGAILQHVVTNADAKVAVVHPDLLDRLLEIEDRGALQTIVTDPAAVGAHAPAFRALGVELLAFEVLEVPAPGGTIACLAPWDLQSICYTSGTTGPSKGVMSSYLHLHQMGWHCTPHVTARDRYLINLPLFHVGGTLFTTGALARGAQIAVMSSFSTPTFLEEATRLGATECLLLGAMAGFLMRSQPSASDRAHSFKRLMIIPLAEDVSAFSERFGVDVYTLFNMSEVSAPIVSELNPTALGTCGRLREGVEARVVDENDCEVPLGTAGELVLRTDCPWTMATGYYKMPDATAKAWRNGWFHTGDMFKADEAGNYFFVDRAKDAIRRRGENISSFEVEEQVLAHPAVLETAVIGVVGEGGEQDVLAVVAPKPGMTIDPAGLIEFLIPRLAHFMVPRYVRLVEALPKTPTSKIEKHALRGEGLTADTWDREAAGMRVRRERLD